MSPTLRATTLTLFSCFPELLASCKESSGVHLDINCHKRDRPLTYCFLPCQSTRPSLRRPGLNESAQRDARAQRKTVFQTGRSVWDGNSNMVSVGLQCKFNLSSCTHRLPVGHGGSQPTFFSLLPLTCEQMTVKHSAMNVTCFFFLIALIADTKS